MHSLLHNLTVLFGSISLFIAPDFSAVHRVTTASPAAQQLAKRELI